MRWIAWCLTPLLVSGCSHSVVIDRDQLDKRYQQTALNPEVLSAVPLRIDPDNPPTVVNWWYTGTDERWHYLAYRELTWSADRKPSGGEQRYRLPLTALMIRTAMARTGDDARWIPLYEAASGISPPANLPTTRMLSDPVRPGTVQPEIVTPDREEPAPIPLPDD